MVLTFGPGHPATHGVLRLLVELSFEVIVKIDTHVGLLHRSTEKLMEVKSVLHSIPYFDRLDYMSCYAQEDALVYAISIYLQLELLWYSSTLRLICLEATRILNHTLAVSCHVADVGAVTPILWLFEERERYYELLERITGARMHLSLYMIHSTGSTSIYGWLYDLASASEITTSRIDECLWVTEDSTILYGRLHNIGIISNLELLSLMCTGPILRSSGISYDLRTWLTDIYTKMSVCTYYSSMSDCYDRMVLRCLEMSESVRLILLGTSLHMTDASTSIRNSLYHTSISSMEELIASFVQLCSIGSNISTTVSSWIETPKGIFGVYIAWLNDSWIFRAKIRCTGIHHLMGMLLYSGGDLIADLVAVIGTMDIVFGEIDK